MQQEYINNSATDLLNTLCSLEEYQNSLESKINTIEKEIDQRFTETSATKVTSPLENSYQALQKELLEVESALLDLVKDKDILNLKSSSPELHQLIKLLDRNRVIIEELKSPKNKD